MRVDNLAVAVEQNPTAAMNAFVRIERAANLVLPGSMVHKRYRDMGEVGLALVVARDGVEPGSYNPLDPTTPERVSLMADNRHEHPGAWAPAKTDEELLGGVAPEGLGRFSAFALGKLNTLTTNTDTSSHRVEGIKVGPGRVGFAGGQRILKAMLAKSGLWEVHDHAVGTVYAHEMVHNSDACASDQEIDLMAERLDQIFTSIHMEHASKEAADLTREQVRGLLSVTDALLSRLLASNGR